MQKTCAYNATENTQTNKMALASQKLKSLLTILGTN